MLDRTLDPLFLRLFNRQIPPGMPPWLIGIGTLLLAAGVGVVAADYGNWAADSIPKLSLLPIAFGGLLWFALDRASVFLFIMLVRSSIDRPLDTFKIGHSGFGSIFNAMMVLLVASFVALAPKRFMTFVLPMWAPFLAISAYAVLHAPDRQVAFSFFLNFCSCMAVFTIPLYIDKLKVDMRLCIWVVLLSTIFPAVYGFLEVARNGLGGKRVNSTFLHENIFAFYLVISFAMAFFLLKSPSFKVSALVRTGVIGWMGVLAVLIGLTGTRSAWAGLVFLFVSYGVFINRKWLVYLVLGGIALAFVPQVQDRFSDILAPARYVSTHTAANSFDWRLTMWKSGLHWLPTSDYLFGRGLDSFFFYSTVFNPQVLQNGAHSVYVQTFFEMGVVGILAAAWMMLWLVVALFGCFRKRYAETMMMGTIVVIFLLFSVSDNLYAYLSFNWYFSFVMGTFCGIVLTQRGVLQPVGAGFEARRDVGHSAPRPYPA